VVRTTKNAIFKITKMAQNWRKLNYYCQCKAKKIMTCSRNIKDLATDAWTGRGKLTIKLKLILCFNLVWLWLEKGRIHCIHGETSRDVETWATQNFWGQQLAFWGGSQLCIHTPISRILCSKPRIKTILLWLAWLAASTLCVIYASSSLCPRLAPPPLPPLPPILCLGRELNPCLYIVEGFNTQRGLFLLG
jgi:hypothetical protein